ILLPSGEAVVKCKPQIDLIKNCPGRGMIITGPAPQGSGFDFYSHFFCPKFGINEASPRGGVLNLHVDDAKQKVFMRGNVVAVMEGSLLV
uniref:Phenazine biosynthesis protein n=1 Tax=Solanum tuberosum TaxID=4113 RepID=M0ZK79_SOLTU